MFCHAIFSVFFPLNATSISSVRLVVTIRALCRYKLDYCFDTGKVPFKDNNLKGDKRFNCDKGKNANSEAVDDLYKVMSMVFGEDSERYKRIIKIPLIQNIL